MSAMNSSRIDRIEFLKSSLKDVHRQLQLSLDMELTKLRKEEELLKKEMRIQSKKEIIAALNKELIKENAKRTKRNLLLNSKTLRKSTSIPHSSSYLSSYLNSIRPVTSQTYSFSDLNKNLNEYLTELEGSVSSLKNKHSELHKVAEDCPVCSSTKYDSLIGDSSRNVSPIQNTDYLSLSGQDKQETTKPNVVFFIYF